MKKVGYYIFSSLYIKMIDKTTYYWNYIEKILNTAKEYYNSNQ